MAGLFHDRQLTAGKGAAMAGFFNSDLVRNFLGGFVLGTVLMFTVGSGDESVPPDGVSPAAAVLDS
jgi:hypothetical protein